jgi:glucose dehydrogenase
VFAAAADFIWALDAKTGQTISTFGMNGRIDLRENLGRAPETQNVRLTSPGVVYRDLMIVGGRVSEGLPASPGDVRAFDVRTGEVVWDAGNTFEQIAIAYGAMANGRISWMVAISAPLVVTGALFLWSSRFQRPPSGAIE